LGRPSFFDAAVEVVMGRMAARIEGEHPHGNSKVRNYFMRIRATVELDLGVGSGGGSAAFFQD
jgi:hypothetical protein